MIFKKELTLMLLIVFAPIGWALDQDSAQEFKIRKRAVTEKFNDFYARQKRQQKRRDQRNKAAIQQKELREEVAEIRDRNRRNFKRPEKISNEEGERLHEEIKLKRERDWSKKRKYYVTRKKEEIRLKETIKKIPENDEFNLPDYDQILWRKEPSTERAGQRRGRSGW